MRGFLVALLAIAWLLDGQVEELLAGYFPVKVFVVEEDHSSITGQIAQAERLHRLYAEDGVRDLVVEGYAGDRAPLRYLPVWLPGIAHRTLLDHGMSSYIHADFLPAVVPRTPFHRMSISFPELAAGNVTAAEFIGAVLPVRLHPGETRQNYEAETNFQSTICETIAVRTVQAAKDNLRSTGSIDTLPYNRAYANALATGGIVTESGTRRLSASSQMVLVRDLLSYFSQQYAGDWQARARVWREVCDDAGAQQVVSVERMLELYTQVKASFSWHGGVADYAVWDRDVRFLEARARASAELAERAAHVARRLGRNVAVVVGAAHSPEVLRRLGGYKGVTAVHLPMSNTFGNLPNLRMIRQEWLARQARRRTGPADLQIVGRSHPLRRSPPVVSEPWFKARHELASVADRLVATAEAYLSTTTGLTGPSVTVAPHEIEPLSKSSDLTGFLLRASVRLAGSEQALWVAARDAGYIQPSTDQTSTNQPDSASTDLRALFAWLRRLSLTDFKREFGERSAAADSSGSDTPLVARLSLRAKAVVARTRTAVVRGLVSLR